METHLELFIKTTASFTNHATEDLRAAIEPCLGDGWKFVPHDQAEAEALQFGEYLFYACEKTRQRESALVALHKTGDDTFSVPNVVSNRKHYLPVAEYNVVLQNFHDTVLTKLPPTYAVLLVARRCPPPEVSL